MTINRRFLLLAGVSGAAISAMIFMPRSAEIDANLVTDPEGRNFGYSDGWIVRVN